MSSENGECSQETSGIITKNDPINLKHFTEKTCPENNAYHILVFHVEEAEISWVVQLSQFPKLSWQIIHDQLYFI